VGRRGGQRRGWRQMWVPEAIAALWVSKEGAQQRTRLIAYAHAGLRCLLDESWGGGWSQQAFNGALVRALVSKLSDRRTVTASQHSHRRFHVTT